MPVTATRLATGLLILTAAVWGSTFFLVHDLVQVIPPLDFLSVRFVLAAAVMLALFHRHVAALSRAQVLAGTGIGAIYGLGQVMQTVGLTSAPASTSGFLTGLYVVLAPLLGYVFLRERLRRTTWLAVGLALAGLAVLSLRSVSFGIGETLTLIGAVLYAAHIVVLSLWSRPEAVLGLGTVQATTIAVACTVAAAPGGITVPEGGQQWAAVAYMGLIAGAGALWSQTWAQAHLTAARAAVAMSFEPVFAATFAVLAGQESLTVRMVLGGALVVAAMIAAEWRSGSDTTLAADDPPAELLHHDV